tara:strand:- start:126 stop:701 length:576 start_codon:yes stop_codon:yes gene_type:complete
VQNSTNKLIDVNRRSILLAFGATLISAAPIYSKSFGFLRGAGDARRIKMYSKITGERINVYYSINSQYITEAINEISYFMRDTRENKVKKIDTRTIDIISATYNMMDTSESYILNSGYRTKKTNEKLRRRSKLVARSSLHVTGQAADISLKSRSVKQISRAAASCAAGGVGRYTRDNFVHIDCGRKRIWGS